MNNQTSSLQKNSWWENEDSCCKPQQKKEEEQKTLAGVGSSLSFPRKSADSQTGPTTSKVETSALGDAGETSSMCWNQTKKRVNSKQEREQLLVMILSSGKKEGTPSNLKL